MVAIPECEEEWGYLFIAFAAEYLDRFSNLSLRDGFLMDAMERRDERIEIESVEYAVFLSNVRLSGPRLVGEEVIVSLSRHPSRQ